MAELATCRRCNQWYVRGRTSAARLDRADGLDDTPPDGSPSAVRYFAPVPDESGTDDDGRNTSDGYDAIRDARAGHAWYLDHGYAATLETPAGVDHNDLGGRFGTVLAEQIDRHS